MKGKSSSSIKNGVAVTLSGQVTRFAIQLVSIAILSRMLSAADFGYLAMVLAIVGVANVLGDFGLSLAAIQRKSLGGTEASNLFWVNSILGLLVALVVASLGPVVSDFYGEPVTLVAVALSVIFLINGIAVQYRVLLTRGQNFSSISIAEVVAQCVGLAIAVGVAFAGAGVMALVAQQISVSVVTLLMLIYFSSWHPSAPRWPLGVMSFVPFGASTTFTQVLNYISVSVQPAALGRYAEVSSVGYYSRAFQIMTLPLQQISAPITRVMLPNLTSARGTLRYPELLLQAHTVFSYLVGGILLVAGANSDIVVSVVLGDRWHEIDSVLRLLAVASVFQIVGYSYYWLCLSEAKMATLLLAELPGRILLIASTVAAAQVGTVAVAVVVAVCSALIWMCSSAAMMLRVDVPIRPAFVVSLRILVLFGVVCAIRMLLETQWPPRSEMIGGAYFVASVFVCLSICVFIPAYRSDFRRIASLSSRFRRTKHLTI